MALPNEQRWRELCPDLRVSTGGARESTSAGAVLSPARADEARKLLIEEGFVQVRSKELGIKETCRKLADAAQRIDEDGWPATFVMVYDEVWELAERMRGLMSATSGGNEINFDLLTWVINASKGQAGFSPHRDRQPEVPARSFRSDGTAMYATCWIALTDATPENSCLHVLPRPHDPGYLAGDDHESDKDPLEVALSSKEAYQRIRALPAEQGSCLLFTHRILHWGSHGEQRCTSPRVSLSFGCSREGESFDPPYLKRTNLPRPSFRLRLALASAQVIAYHERFEPSLDMLKRCHASFQEERGAFNAAYAVKVDQEYACALQEALARRSVAPSPSAVVARDEDSEEDEAVDAALAAMLRAESEGSAPLFEDDFDALADEDDFEEEEAEEDEEGTLASDSEDERVRAEIMQKMARARVRRLRRAQGEAAAAVRPHTPSFLARKLTKHAFQERKRRMQPFLRSNFTSRHA